MPAPLHITFLRDPDWEPGVRVELEIDGETQPDRILPLAGLEHLVMGYQVFGDFMFGAAHGLELGEGLFGAGELGLGADTLTHTTLKRFPTADLPVRLRTLDPAGNPSPWSQPLLVEHRPPPEPPRNLALGPAGETLTWQWP